MKIAQRGILLVPAALVLGLLLACENLALSPEQKCYYDDSGQLVIEIQCAAQRPSGSWKLCGNTTTIAACTGWLRRQGIAA